MFQEAGAVSAFINGDLDTRPRRWDLEPEPRILVSC